MRASGVYAAVITPRSQAGEADFGAVFDLLDFLARAQVDGIALFTAVGEYFALGQAERSRLVYLAVKRSRAPVLAGVGAATLDASVRLAREARDAGAAGLLLPPPYFFRYEPEDVREFYTRFAAESGTAAQTLLSSHPEHGCGIDAETARWLMTETGFAGIEEGGEIPAGLGAACVLAGGDARLATSLRVGAAGAVSATAGVAPEIVLALARAICNGHKEEAARAERVLAEFIRWRREFPEPALLKIAAAARGLKTGALLIPLSTAKQRRAEEFREWFLGWLPAGKHSAKA